jgi:hypothetical protein
MALGESTPPVLAAIPRIISSSMALPPPEPPPAPLEAEAAAEAISRIMSAIEPAISEPTAEWRPRAGDSTFLLCFLSARPKAVGFDDAAGFRRRESRLMMQRVFAIEHMHATAAFAELEEAPVRHA